MRKVEEEEDAMLLRHNRDKNALVRTPARPRTPAPPFARPSDLRAPRAPPSHVAPPSLSRPLIPHGIPHGTSYGSSGS